MKSITVFVVVSDQEKDGIPAITVQLRLLINTVNSVIL